MLNIGVSEILTKDELYLLPKLLSRIVFYIKLHPQLILKISMLHIMFIRIKPLTTLHNSGITKQAIQSCKKKVKKG